MSVVRSSTRYIDLRARAELLSGVGAGVLGAGLALLFHEYLVTLALPFLLIGGAVHALAMYEKHSLDAAEETVAPGWIVWAYWTCWLLLVALAAYVWWSRAPS